MKYISWICLVFVMAVSNVYAEPENDEARMHSDLKALLGEVVTALNNKDLDKLSGMLQEDVVVTFLNGEVARGLPAVRTYFNKVLGGDSSILKDYRTSAKENAPARIVNNMALADGIANDEFIFADGSTMSVKTNWSTVVINQDGQWKVSQLHFSSNMFDNPLANAAKNKMMMVGIIAIVIGLIIGFLLGRKMRK